MNARGIIQDDKFWTAACVRWMMKQENINGNRDIKPKCKAMLKGPGRNYVNETKSLQCFKKKSAGRKKKVARLSGTPDAADPWESGEAEFAEESEPASEIPTMAAVRLTIATETKKNLILKMAYGANGFIKKRGRFVLFSE